MPSFPWSVQFATCLLAGIVSVGASSVHAQSGKETGKEPSMPLNTTLPPQKAMTPAEREAMERSAKTNMPLLPAPPAGSKSTIPAGPQKALPLSVGGSPPSINPPTNLPGPGPQK
jgi:hypothetical protein